MLRASTALNSIKNPPEHLAGVFWALLATLLFSIVAAMAKMAALEYHVLQILFIRQVVVTLSSLPSIARSFPHSLKTQYPLLHGLRLVGSFVALACGIWAVTELPLTTAITLGFSKVFFITVLSILFLGEVVGMHRISAVVLGFLGVVIAMKPGTEGLFELSTLIPLLGAAGAAVAVTTARRLSQTESTATMLLFQALFVGGLAAVPMFWFWKTPDLEGLLFLLVLSILATVGQWSGIQALREGEASILGSIEYTKLIYVALLGFILFAEIPDLYTILGAALIVGSAAYMLHREAIKKRGAQQSLMDTGSQ
ncbi:DMT family transporter [Flexibacterium corallicola]|uniref:DMT family transporter n=1 Tax=Flexibacterium corallicola TaxID=3037259 RepID=UPI00286F5C9F|nr:DMT family transporter [Pseudovibrio sp. M1P-2-3]